MAMQSADWAVEQYEAVRALLPDAEMPSQSKRAANLLEYADAFDVFLLDAFGVLNVGDTAIPGALETVKTLQDMGKRVLVVTNSATFPTDISLGKYSRLGFEFRLEDIVSSRDVLSAGLCEEAKAGPWAAMSATGSQLNSLSLACERLGLDPSAYDAAGGFILLSSAEWSDAHQDLLQNSLRKNPRPVLVGNPDIVAPREHGLSREPGFFAYGLFKELALRPRMFGKPFGNIFEMALSRLPEVDPSRIAMVGDTLHTDVLGGAARGFKTILVTDHGLFSGCDSSKYIKRTGIVPDYIIPEI